MDGHINRLIDGWTALAEYGYRLANRFF